MGYRECSGCSVVTDENESKCPVCGKKPLNNEIIAFEEIISRIKKREIPFSNIWTKSPDEIRKVLESPPR